MHVPASSERVTAHTAEQANERIFTETRMRIDYYARHPAQIGQRLEELDQEWDTERILETNAASLVVLGTLMGAAVSRKWLLLPMAVGGFLLQHGVQGWCPPLGVLRRMGVRTAREIEAERYALKSIRGDFDGIKSKGQDGAEAAADATGRLDFYWGGGDETLRSRM